MDDSDIKEERNPSLPGAARVLLTEVLHALVGRAPELLDEASRPPDDTLPLLDDLLSKADTYRDGMLTLLAFPVAAGSPMDLTSGLMPGGRGVAQHVASLLAELDIPGRKDALQTIAKGSPNYLGRARTSWNELLSWASVQTSVMPIRAAWLYLAAGIAATARSLPPLPPIDTPRLTFSTMASLFDDLLATPSNGAYEQFIFASLLAAYVEQLGQRAKERVTTKSLNAADASAGTAGDVQHVAGGQVLEAYEVTANEWEGKVPQAIEALHKHDLARVHIVARAPDATGAEIASELSDPSLDVSVLDFRHEARSLSDRLLKPYRRAALEYVYDHLAHRQPRDDLVVAYVDALTRHGLTA
jgi:hypothetical protein